MALLDGTLTAADLICLPISCLRQPSPPRLPHPLSLMLHANAVALKASCSRALTSACSPKDLSLPGIPLGTAFSQGQEASGRDSLGMRFIGNTLGHTDKESQGMPTAWPDRVYAPSRELHRVRFDGIERQISLRY